MANVNKEKNRNEKTNRVPKKPLNQFIKAALLDTLKRRNDLVIEEKAHAGSASITVKDTKGKFLFSFENGWDYGVYQIYMVDPQKPNGEKMLVGDMEWFENDDNTNPQQQDIFDILDAVSKKSADLKKLEAQRKAMSKEQLQTLNALGL